MSEKSKKVPIVYEPSNLINTSEDQKASNRSIEVEE